MTLLLTEGEKHMALYTLGAANCSINQIRSNDADTLVASMGLQVMNAEGALHHAWDPQSVNLGTWGAGGFPTIDLFYPNVDVPDPTQESADGGAIYWSFLLVNSGKWADADFVNTFLDAANAVAQFAKVTGNIIVQVAAGIIAGTDALVKLLDAGCDGVVAAHSFALTAAELANMTAGNTNWWKTQNYPGTSASPICGAISNYDVTYEVSGPAIAVPNLVGQEWKNAPSIANQAGLGIRVIRNVVSPTTVVPTVGYQIPHSQSLVPRGTTIEVIVDNPPKVRP
jgi:hypothetical protein